jgi:amidase
VTVDEYRAFDATELARLIREGATTPEELLDLAIERVDATNPALNAVIEPLFAFARQAIAKGLPNGPFRGVPLLLKDQIDLGGVRTQRACRLLTGHVAPVDSAYVGRLRAAGMVVFGKTNMPELGLNVTTEPLLHGPTRNPWNQTYSAGGSSGGSAAAVAAGFCPVASATDGGGSIRIPAACCGVFGLKPSRGRISFAPDRGENWGGLGTHGVVSRSVRDSAAFLDLLSGPVSGDPYYLPSPVEPFVTALRRKTGRLRIAVVSTPPSGIAIHGECRTALEDATRLLADLGHEMIDAELPVNGSELREASGLIIRTKVAESIEVMISSRRRRLNQDDLEPTTRLIYEAGKQVTGTQYSGAIATIHRLGRQMAGFMEKVDVVLSPTLAEPPLLNGLLNRMTEDSSALFARMRSYSPFCNLYNATGQPAMSVPLHWGENNLPIGVQFAAACGGESLLLQLAAQLESARPWQQRYNWLGFESGK